MSRTTLSYRHFTDGYRQDTLPALNTLYRNYNVHELQPATLILLLSGLS